MHSSQLCHRRSARHWSPLIELPTEVVSRVASFLNGGDLARLLITAKAFMDAHGVILNAQIKRAWDQRAAALTVYTNRGPLGDLMYELGSRPRGVFQGEVLKRYLQTTPSGLIDPRMTMSVESFAALSDTEQGLLAAAFNATVNRALDATTVPASWDDEDRRALDDELMWATDKVEELAEHDSWISDQGLKRVVSEIDRGAIAAGLRRMVGVTGIDEGGGFLDDNDWKWVGTGFEWPVTEQDFFICGDTEGVTPHLLQCIAHGPKAMTSHYGGTPAFLARVHEWFHSSYENIFHNIS